MGGEKTALRVWPWMAGMHHAKYGAYVVCGATIVSSTHAITAAHCTHRYKAKELLLTAGHVTVFEAFEEKGYQRRTVKKIIQHPEYNKQKLTNDLSILELHKPWAIGLNLDKTKKMLPKI